ncbi:hypothetical protein FACS1894166_13380 [Bacilli bacterium]|nr:hypothetical protein FACS1894166_13380 [Bacilli bacterium]
MTKVILGEGPYTFDRHCFADCKKLEDIDMSNAEVVIHGRAFNNDEELSEIKLSSSKSINLGSEALYNLASLE